MGDFEQIEIRNGDRQYTSRNLSFTPVRIGELISLLQFAEGSEGLQAKKQKERVENGIEMVCIRVEGEGRGKTHFDFGGHRYPRKLQLLVNGVKVITATVDNLTTTAFDKTLLVAPKGAIERRQCADMKHAVPVKTPDPMYPKSASENKLMGDTTVAMTVLADGSVSDIRLVGSAARSMDDATANSEKLEIQARHVRGGASRLRHRGRC